MSDDTTQLRRRHDELTDDLDRVQFAPAEGVAVLVCKVVSGTVAGTMFGVQMQDTTCVETEGATPTFAAVGSTFFALHLGSTAPAVGSPVLMVQVDGTWFFRS